MTDTGATAIGTPQTPRRRRFGRGLSIQSKLLIMLLAVSLLSSIVVGAIGFINGRQSLHAAAVDQLITIRSMRAAEVIDAIDDAKESASLHSRNLSAQTLSTALNAAFDELQQQEISEEQQAQLEAYYADTFIPELEKRSGEEYGTEAFIPESNAGRYLQLVALVRGPTAPIRPRRRRERSAGRAEDARGSADRDRLQSASARG